MRSLESRKDEERTKRAERVWNVDSRKEEECIESSKGRGVHCT